MIDAAASLDEVLGLPAASHVAGASFDGHTALASAHGGITDPEVAEALSMVKAEEEANVGGYTPMQAIDTISNCSAHIGDGIFAGALADAPTGGPLRGATAIN